MELVIKALISFVVNWSLKLAVAGLFYAIVTALGAPMWIVIAVTAIGAAETKVELDWQ